ncbi:MAG: hypothetical protein KGH68_02895 [Patescibacteria group bacterium]|nr:hypothetical protein [Patescibacteria group bacterium]
MKRTRLIGFWILIGVIVILIGTFIYFWNIEHLPGSPTAKTPAAGIAPVSPSDDVSSLEKDLKATDPGPDLSNLNGLGQ